MKTKTVLVCESCEKPILRKEEGFLIQGSIAPADPTAKPIVGVAVPVKQTLQPKDIVTSAFCTPCFGKLLGVGISTRVPNAEESSDAMVAGPTMATGPVVQVGSVRQVAPGAHVIAGPVLPTKNVDLLPVIPGLPQVGDTVRVTKAHRYYDQLRGKAAAVERFREDDSKFVLLFSGGSPMLASPGEVERIGTR